MRSREFAAGKVDTGFIDANLGRLGAQPHPANRKAVHAAARLLLERRDEGRPSRLDPFDPWRVADSFELIGSRRIALDITVDGVPMRVHLIEGANVDPVEKNEGRGVTLHAANGGVYAFAGGRQSFVELVDPFAKAEAGAEEGDAAIRAPMNGRLVAVAVEYGDIVEAGHRLAVVEAMKMEHALVAPFAGVVRDLDANVGDQVEMGERIMWIEKEGEGKGPAEGK
jgi:3-methylcrotonyl-CoA carboxylase alpha subunit